MASRRAISSALRTASRTRAASPSPCPRALLHRPSPAGFLFNRAAAYASSAAAQTVSIEQGNCIKFFMATEFCEFSPEIEDHFEIFENIGGFNVTIVTSASSKEETSLLWSGFLLKDEGQAFQDAKNEKVGYLAFLAALVASYL
ncbi:hypothetical protein ACQ4PT_052780 [Festuca glaucescens]